MLHEFKTSLAESHEFAEAPWWRDVYKQAFPGFQSMTNVLDDGWGQRGGIDRVIVLKSGKTITVDEKVRKKNWPDIALERWSDRKRKTPGWVQKNLACDFIAYVFLPSKRCYMLPFIPLRAAWNQNGREWCRLAENNLNGFNVVLAENKGYTTESIGVPIKTLLTSLQVSMIIDWEAAV